MICTHVDLDARAIWHLQLDPEQLYADQREEPPVAEPDHEWDGFPLTWESYDWRPSIFMPRWASRILLEVTEVRVERLQDISEADAKAEGIIPHVRGGWHWREHNPSDLDDWDQFGFKTARDAYGALWESINGPGSWEANPWVWAVSFRRLHA